MKKVKVQVKSRNTAPHRIHIRIWCGVVVMYIDVCDICKYRNVYGYEYVFFKFVGCKIILLFVRSYLLVSYLPPPTLSYSLPTCKVRISRHHTYHTCHTYMPYIHTYIVAM